MPLQPFARWNSGAALATPASNCSSQPGFTSIAAISRIIAGLLRRSDDALAGRLRIEQPVGLLGLLQRPVMGEQAIDVDAAVGDVAPALGLPDARECPRSDDRDLA